MTAVLAAIGLAAIITTVATVVAFGAVRYVEHRHYNSVEARRARIAELELALGIMDPIYAVVLPAPPAPVPPDPEALRKGVEATRKRRREVARRARPRYGRDA